jgi:UDP-N-acetylenolpyruvoylglucosamine reductase
MGSLTLERLRTDIHGTVIGVDDVGYDEARRVYNAMIDKRPRVVIRARGTQDVVCALQYVRENDLDVAVRGGSHSVPGFGTCDDGVVIDLSSMKDVSVDAAASRARVAGGATWGDFNAATYPYGLATTGGIISTTGVGGLTLGGGIGYLDRGLGLSCDNLVSAEVVTADGRVLTASENENADLFWALRGGGGNFGIVTSFEFRLSPVKDVYGGPMFFDLERARDVLELFRDVIADAPEQLGGFPAFQIAPPLPFLPENRHGDPLVAIVACWSGPLDEGERAVRAFHDAAPIVGEMVGEMPYPALNSAFDGLVPPGLQHYWKANFNVELTDEAIAGHLEHAAGLPAVNSTVHIYPINGACHRVGADDTAFAYRDANFATVIGGMWPDPAQNEANTRWVREYYEATAPHSESGGYVNFMSGDDQGRVEMNYRGHYDRLVEVKRAYDPDNVFHVNQNIAP